MKKIFICLLLTMVLLLPAETIVYAADEDLIYSEYVDEVAGIDTPYWSFDYYPELSFEHKFLFFEWGEAETVAWDIDTVSFYFTIINEHKGIFNVGYNPSDMDITFEYVYSSVDETLNCYTSSASFTYSLMDLDISTDYVEFNFPYEEVLAGCEYYEQGYDTVIKSVEIFISSRVLKTHGTCMHYEFYSDGNYAKQIYTGIDYYVMTDEDMRLVSNRAEVFKGDDDGTGDGNGGNIEKHHYVVVYPDSYQEDLFDLNDIITTIFIDFPNAIWNTIEFLFTFILMLPSLIHMVMPFIPEYLIAAIMFVIVFGVVWGFIAWIRKIKGD